MNPCENNPFFSKIMYEEQFCQNDCFGVVADADPITAGHYMIYSKIFKPSVADCDYLNAATFIREAFLPKVEVPYAYFERGRASFCTSMQGVKHAHAHLVPRFADYMEALFPYGTALRHSSMEDAYRNAPKEGEYLIWGNMDGPFYLINHPEEIPKRAIRNTILQCRLALDVSSF